MQIMLKKCSYLANWYVIVRVEHCHESWWESTEYGKRFMSSERLSPEACIEGTAEEMLYIAVAIKNRGRAQFKRCEVYCNEQGFCFSSPKNSEHVVTISEDYAMAFADQVIQLLANK